MSTDLTIFQENTGMELAPEFHDIVAAGLNNDLSEGVGGGFAVVSIRGGRFRIKHKGVEIPITNEKNEPVASIETVILRANGHITKQWYSKSFDEGDAEAPDCFSLDGVNPAAGAPHPQARTCAACPKNVFGSAPPRQDGSVSKAKACSDNRKLAIVPLTDIDNEQFGGPMLFRVPPSSLNDLAQFGAAMKARGYPYNAIGVRIGMDINVSHPKPTFAAIRPLTSDEAAKVLALVHAPSVEKILNDFDPGQAPATQPPAAGAFEQEPEAVPTPPPPPARAATPPPAKAAAPKAPPATAAPAAATFGKKPGASAPAAAAAPAAPKAAKPAAPKKATPPPPPPQAAEPAGGDEGTATEPAGDPDASTDIEDILRQLGAPAGE